MLRRLLLAISILAALGCSPSGSEKRAIETVAEKRVKALNSMDLNLYLSVLSRAYSDKGKDYKEISADLERNFRTLDRIDYRQSDRRIAAKGDTATVSAAYELRINMKGNPIELSGKENLRLKKEAGAWKIVGGL